MSEMPTVMMVEEMMAAIEQIITGASMSQRCRVP
jgi:hypothetical protein